MSKRKSPGTNSRSLASASVGLSDGRLGEPAPATGIHHHLPSAASVRETVESIVIAFVLAFLFRTFEAEAFVIPTGSMAPTLMGRHKDVVCPKCGSPYQVSASEEVTPDGVPKSDRFSNGDIIPVRVVSGVCPMCRATMELENDSSYNGDRLLVSKFAYEVGDPKRWDVVVFKYPGDPPGDPAVGRTDSRINFIKRLVGLPGDTIRIQDGDIFVSRSENKNGSDRNVPGVGKFSIARKPPQKLLAMFQPVFDNDYMPQIAESGWPARWSVDDSKASGAWLAGDSASFSIDGSAKNEQWLRYHHRVPYTAWQQANGQPQFSPNSQLITDGTAYDTGKTNRGYGNHSVDPDGLGVHWVGDLAVECTADVKSPGGSLVFELRKGGRRFECRFDLSTGQAALSISGRDMAAWRPTAATNVRGPGEHKILFSNCDNELLLWVDGRVVSFDRPTTYEDLRNTQPDAADLEPVGIASTGAQLRISRLRILRDIYYIADRYRDPDRHDVMYRYGQALPGKSQHTPEISYIDFELKKDQFFMLGDNSAMSRDGRLWGPEYWVSRELLIGKALFIYWPHSWDRIPYTNIPCPYFPNFGRMGPVR